MGGRVTEGYSTLDVCELTGASYRQLDYWIRTGAVTPSIATARGSGSRRLFSEADVAGVRAIVEARRLIATLNRQIDAGETFRAAGGEALVP